jgi:hypothetical protein
MLQSTQSLNIAWTIHVWQMVPMLMCNVQNKLWDFLS